MADTDFDPAELEKPRAPKAAREKSAFEKTLEAYKSGVKSRSSGSGGGRGSNQGGGGRFASEGGA